MFVHPAEAAGQEEPHANAAEGEAGSFGGRPDSSGNASAPRLASAAVQTGIALR